MVWDGNRNESMPDNSTHLFPSCAHVHTDGTSGSYSWRATSCNDTKEGYNTCWLVLSVLLHCKMDWIVLTEHGYLGYN